MQEAGDVVRLIMDLFHACLQIGIVIAVIVQKARGGVLNVIGGVMGITVPRPTDDTGPIHPLQRHMLEAEASILISVRILS